MMLRTCTSVMVKGGYDYKPLTEGQVIGKAHWQGDAASVDIEFEEHNVSFQVDGDMLKVLASATVTVTEEQFVENTVLLGRLYIIQWTLIILRRSMDRMGRH